MILRRWAIHILWWLTIIALTGVYLHLLTRTDLEPLRPVYTLLYLLLVPGAIWVRCLRIPNVWISLALCAPLSLALIMLISQLSLYLRIYSLQTNAVLLLLASAMGILLDMFIVAQQTRRTQKRMSNTV